MYSNKEEEFFIKSCMKVYNIFECETTTTKRQLSAKKRTEKHTFSIAFMVTVFYPLLLLLQNLHFRSFKQISLLLLLVRFQVASTVNHTQCSK